MRPYRKERIASAIRSIVGSAIAHKLQDPRVSGLTTVTRVELSADLQLAKVYLSVPGESACERKTMAAMRHATGYIRRMVAHQLQLRQCPELRFMIDDGIKGAREVLKLLEENRRGHPERSGCEPPMRDSNLAPDIEVTELRPSGSMDGEETSG
jgi:ribosome-binding factor A